MIGWCSRRLSGRERGAALVEAAIVIPLLLLIVMGVIDIGRLLSTSAKVQEASQEGALFASYAPSDYLEVRDRVLDSLEDFDIAPSSITVVCAANDAIEVSIIHHVDLVTPWISEILGSSIAVTGDAVGKNFTDESCSPTP